MAPPLFDDDEKTRVARLLHILLLTSCLGAIGWVIYQSVTKTSEFDIVSGLVIVAVMLIGVSISWSMMRLGRIRAASVIYTLLAWLILVYRSIESGGVTAFEYPTIVLVPVIASVLLGARAAVVTGGVSVLTGLGLVFAEATRILVPETSPTTITAVDVWISRGIDLLIVSALLCLTGRSLAGALERSRHENYELENAYRSMQERLRMDQKQHEQLSSLLERGITFLSALEPQKVLDEVCREVVSLLDVTSAYVCDWDDERLVATVVAEHFGAEASAAEKVSDMGQEYYQDEDINTWLKTERPAVLRLSDPDLEPVERDEMLQYGAKCILRIPVTARGRIFGYFEIYESRQERNFTETEVLVARNLASQAGIALDNARLLEAIGETVRKVSTAVEEIQSAAAEQDARAKEQSTAVSRVAGTIDETCTIAEETARSARDVAELAQRTAVLSDRGQQAVVAAIEGIEQVKQGVGSISNDVISLTEQARSISQIITTVNDIANQSNVLALNAAMEAARAEEAGRGFGVVAEEMQRLASESREGTEQVEGLLNKIQNGVNAVLSTAMTGIEHADAGTEVTAEAGEVISQLAAGVSKSAAAAGQISNAVERQLEEMELISQAMGQMNQIAAQNLDGSRQVRMATEGLSELAGELSRLVVLHRE
jgi:methyl-accepting chemotaxis protein